MSLRERTRPGLGIIEPCLASPATAPPSGPGWLDEIKADGRDQLFFRLECVGQTAVPICLCASVIQIWKCE
jgi:hypothetical protein